MRTIKKLHIPEYAPIADLITYRVLPTRSIEYLDPFLFLNHHGPQVYPPHNGGLPFGPHPHRGMETVTFVLSGDIAHKDSGGHNSVMVAGGVQWMTAGRGLIHAEVSSDEFMRTGGPLEILQLWINLPARAKMTEPFYKGLQKEEIPSLKFDEGKVTVNLISGDWDGHQAAFQSGIGVQLNTIEFTQGGKLEIPVPQSHHIFFYVISGRLNVNGTDVPKLTLAEFNQDGEGLEIFADEDSVLLFGHAQPLNEPVVSQGPFVMNTEEEIHQAYADYRAGKFGSWKN
ncbi:pirin family protein [Mucilaginibacter paludis]|uniref:Pirin domain protein n=1 Tax=Mucilaginibacter paludis DSM 18603 TaxID=714943 RepID=H1Y7L5_9SPHI|nr:pirin family protein [Mucilaginibacter paludis]EHQ29436.1 Pirin domain protein [Mucilaginibacter paludis DSM 18603]